MHFESDVISLHKNFNMMDKYSVVDWIFQVFKHFVINKERTYFENNIKLLALNYYEI